MAESPEQRSARISAQNRKRWERDRERMTAIAAANAAKATAALQGTHYTPERSKRASVGQRGKVMTGEKWAMGPAHTFAEEFRLLDPRGTLHVGRNLLHFVRCNASLFDPSDVRPQKGSCRAARKLSRLRPGVSEQRKSWKGWAWSA